MPTMDRTTKLVAGCTLELDDQRGYVRVRASKYGVCSCMGGGWLGGFQDGQHGHAPAKEAQPVMVGGDMLAVAGAGAEKVAQLIMTSTEPPG